uniref:Uncharacterized protein n=1 Tax=Rhizophora mucronata TaxID=61149 RepID=A0A2P2QCC2_RHIMU
MHGIFFECPLQLSNVTFTFRLKNMWVLQKWVA